jgi:hypothetical protein
VSVGLPALVDKTRGRHLNRSIHNRSTPHINSVGKWLFTRDAPRVRVAGENLGVAFCALADWRRGRLPKVYNDLFLIHLDTL